MFKNVLILSILAILFCACNSNDQDLIKSEKDEEFIKLKNFVFDIENNSFITKFNTIENPYEVCFANKFIIYTKINFGDEPELYILDIDNNVTTKITNNDFIEFNPVINNNGNFAYALSELSTNRSKVYYGTELLYLDENKLYKNLAISEKYLLFSDNENLIYIYDLITKNIITIPIHGYIEKISYVSNEVFAIQYFSKVTNSMDVSYYDVTSNQYTILLSSYKDEILKQNFIDDGLLVSVIDDTQRNIKLLFNALHSYYGNKLANPFARSNNFMGRIGWNQSDQLENLLDLYNILHDNRILRQIELTIEALLNSNNNSLNVINEFNSEFSYATKKYSLDNTTEISFIVHDAKIYYAMLRCINEIQTINPIIKSTIIQRAQSIYEYYDKYYEYNDNLYRFQYSMDYKYDGVWTPYNMQNAFGLMLIQLYKSTNVDKYKDRAMKLAQQFKKEFLYIDSEVMWHYMPMNYYLGWSNEDNISVNLPLKEAFLDNNFEDTAHAGLNAKFIIHFYNNFPNLVFQDNDIISLGSTLTSLIDNNSFSRFLNISSEVNMFSYSYFLKDGWSLLGNDELKDMSTRLTPSFVPDFDITTNHYINNIDNGDVINEKLEILEIFFDNNLTKIQTIKIEYNIGNIQKYFEYD